MTRTPDEPKSWPAEADAETVLGDLRRQIDAVKARLEEHRLQMHAAGLTTERDAPESAS